MSRLIAIVGDTGSGKSHSIQFLDPKETYIVNVAGKELPFRGSSLLYNRDSKNFKEEADSNEIMRLLQTISEKALHIKTVIIEDGNYIMGFNLVDKATEIGYSKFSIMARDMVNLIQSAKKLRDDLTIIYFSHQEELEDGGDIASYKMKTAGKMIDNQIKMEGLFTVVLYAITEAKGDKVDYCFITNRYKKYPAKSPMGMFTEIKIPNNLKTVVDSVNQYYV
jgi:ABC-type dipeptide/oligopeptide/nickel transport system ATPase component